MIALGIVVGFYGNDTVRRIPVIALGKCANHIKIRWYNGIIKRNVLITAGAFILIGKLVLAYTPDFEPEPALDYN